MVLKYDHILWFLKISTKQHHYLTTFSEEQCRDVEPQRKCDRWKSRGKCGKNWAKTRCPKTCDECKIFLRFTCFNNSTLNIFQWWKLFYQTFVSKFTLTGTDDEVEPTTKPTTMKPPTRPTSNVFPLGKSYDAYFAAAEPNKPPPITTISYDSI